MAKLIMIDDNPMEHMIMKKMFQNNAIFKDATYSLDGQSVIITLKEHLKNKEVLPDLIFLDLNMPEFSGWDFLEEFTLLYPEFPKLIHIYIISSSVDPHDHKRAKQYNFVKSFLTKPVSKDALIDITTSIK